MKSIIFALMLCYIQSMAQTVTRHAEFDQKIEDTFFSGNSRQSDLTWITDANRPLVVENLQQRAIDQYEGPYVKEALVRAGHWDTILGLIEDLKNGDPLKDRDTKLLSYTNQEIIPYLMPLVYTGSIIAPNSPGDDVIKSSPRSHAIYSVLGKIWKCEDFPQKIRKWAKDMSSNNRFNGPKDEAWVALITSWWEHNQVAILEKRYKDATWLPSYKGVPINRTPEEMHQIVDFLEKDNATRLAMRTSPTDAPGVLPRRTTLRPGETFEGNPEELPSPLIWIGIGAIIAAAGIFFWRKFAAKNA